MFTVGSNELANGLVELISLIVLLVVAETTEGTVDADDGGGGGGGGALYGGFVDDDGGGGLGGNGRLPVENDGPLDSFEPLRFIIGGGTDVVGGCDDCG